MNWIPIREGEQGIEEKKGEKIYKIILLLLGIYDIFVNV